MRPMQAIPGRGKESFRGNLDEHPIVSYLKVKRTHVILTFIVCRMRYTFLTAATHPRSQDFCWGGGTRPTPPSFATLVYTFEAVASSWGSVSAPAVNRVMGGVPERNKNTQKI